MGTFHRQVAYEMIQRSVRDHRLDTRQLEDLTESWAGEIARYAIVEQRHPRITDAREVARLAAAVPANDPIYLMQKEDWTRRLTRASYEVLGLVDRHQWNDTRHAPSNIDSWASAHSIPRWRHLIGHEPDYQVWTGLDCRAFMPDILRALRSQNVACVDGVFPERPPTLPAAHAVPPASRQSPRP